MEELQRLVYPQLRVIHLPSREINVFFTKRKRNKIDLVARPGTPPAQIAVASVVTIVAVKLA